MRVSSNAFARVCILRARRSRSLLAWWLALHVLLAVSVLTSTVGLIWSGMLLLAVCVHAWIRLPGSSILLLRFGDGSWAIPEQGRFKLQLAPNSSYSTVWVRLVFEADGARNTVLLLRDQMETEDWRRLQVAVRE